MRRVESANRRPGLRRAGPALALLLGLAAPAAAEQEQMTPPPPTAQFREGDRWQSWGQDAFGRATNSLKVYEKRKGAWVALSGINDRSDARDSRSFEQIKDPIFYPAAPYENKFFATVDGLLHRYVGGRWVDLPIGSTLTDKRGTAYKIDVRATAYDADQLSQIFSHTALSEKPIGENRTSPILLPSAEELALAADTSAGPTPAEAPAATPDEPPAAAPDKPSEAEPASAGMSLKMAVLYLLLGAIAALVLVKLLGRKPAPPTP